MTIGGSIFLVAVGAIIRYAVTIEIGGVNLDVLGLILIIAGIAGLLIGIGLMLFRGDRGDVVERRTTRSRSEPPPP